METKAHIRKQIFSRRAEHSDEEIRFWSEQIAQRFCMLKEYQEADRILAYADYKHEVMTGPMIRRAWEDGKEVAVPKVEGREMVFYRLTDFSQLSPGYYGIPEPDGTDAVDWEKALMIMPGVAFDRRNHRVGYGGGFYDRYLKKHPEIVRVAVAFEFQILDGVPAEETDICPQIILTETGKYEI